MSDADVRLVPMTRAQQMAALSGAVAIRIAYNHTTEKQEADIRALSDLDTAYDAAPADPAETVLRQMKAGPALQALCDGTGDEWLTGAILEALGFVVSSTETSTPDA